MDEAETPSISQSLLRFLKQSDYIAIFININPFRRRMGGQSRHRPHITADRIYKTCANACANFTNRQSKTAWSTLQTCIVAEAQVSFCHTDRELAETVGFVIFDLFGGLRSETDIFCTIDFGRNSFDFLSNRLIQIT